MLINIYHIGFAHICQINKHVYDSKKLSCTMNYMVENAVNLIIFVILLNKNRILNDFAVFLPQKLEKLGLNKKMGCIHTCHWLADQGYPLYRIPAHAVDYTPGT
jgi:hypothetical protein